MILNPRANVRNINRADFRIHGTRQHFINNRKQLQIDGNHGCISPIGNTCSKPFLDRMNQYFDDPTNKSIKVIVNITGNANVRKQINTPGSKFVRDYRDVKY